MTSNIHDTKIHKIKSEVNNLIKELSHDTVISAYYLQQKYNYLYTTSKSLFDLILKECMAGDFNKDDFDKKLNKMLLLIFKVQSNELTQNQASENIGTILAKEYIPQCNEN